MNFPNQEPLAVVEGRPFLYDAQFTSANGEASCSSCHIFGDLDHLGWDLGNPDDIVVTADILLAGRCVKAGARVIGPTGKVFTQDNVDQAVATRNLMASLRDAGEMVGGPPPLQKKDRSRFLQKLDEIIQAIRRDHSE